jgi:beta-lactamase class A
MFACEINLQLLSPAKALFETSDRMINIRLFLASLLFVIAITVTITYWVTSQANNLTAAQQATDAPAQALAELPQQTIDCDVRFVRMGDYAFIRPLVFAEVDYQSERLTPLKNELKELILQAQKNQRIIRASVMLKDLNSADWMEVNGNELYHSGSMMKVAILMTWLAMSERDPTLFSKDMRLIVKLPELATNTSGEQLEQGKSYPVEYLLRSMIVYSNNDATNLLIENMDKNEYNKLWRSVGSQPHNLGDIQHTLLPNEFSKLFRLLYNATYLSKASSEYALSLMTESSFRDGLVKFLPENQKVSHKFGERFSGAGQQFHESGIVYLNNHPYSIVIMTEGADATHLPDVLAEISKRCYDYMKKL